VTPHRPSNAELLRLSMIREGAGSPQRHLQFNAVSGRIIRATHIALDLGS
jgi:hypothetical protein